MSLSFIKYPGSNNSGSYITDITTLRPKPSTGNFMVSKGIFFWRNEAMKRAYNVGLFQRFLKNY